MPGSADIRETILVLGGTFEANRLVERIAAARPDTRVILSLAGRTATPKRPKSGDIRIGGFGGVEGLSAFLREERVTHLVDATHPFAERMTRNAEEAAGKAGIVRVALVRPSWRQEERDRWHAVASVEEAAALLPTGTRAFLALGRQYLHAFVRRPDLNLVVRMIEPPETPLPFEARIVFGRPSLDPSEEATLFEECGITHLVCRNAGGTASYAKIVAARTLRLPVIMIERPRPPEPPVAETIEAILDALAMPV